MKSLYYTDNISSNILSEGDFDEDTSLDDDGEYDAGENDDDEDTSLDDTS